MRRESDWFCFGLLIVFCLAVVAGLLTAAILSDTRPNVVTPAGFYPGDEWFWTGGR
jgi:hypothetical protein